MMDWQVVRQLAATQPELLTKTNVPFCIVEATEGSIVIEVSSGRRHTVSRANLEKAIQLLRQGETIAGPSDYRHKVADDRPAYAWAILRELGYLAWSASLDNRVHGPRTLLQTSRHSSPLTDATGSKHGGRIEGWALA